MVAKVEKKMIKEKILMMVLPSLVELITAMISEENKQKYGKMLFDMMEQFVLDSETTIDDIVVLPIVKAARNALGIK
jgi:hypothetical protein